MKDMQVLSKRAIAQQFNYAANHYDDVANLQRQIADEMLLGLSDVVLKDDLLLEIGSGTGYLTRGLSQHWPDAQIMSIDIAELMVKKTATQVSQQGNCYCLCADTDHLPFASLSMPLIVSNLALQWCSNLLVTFSEYQRILTPNGQLIFTTFGPNTLKELRASWAAVDHEVHVNYFEDEATIKSNLMGSGFKVDEMVSKFVTLHYSDVMNLMCRLKILGAANINPGRARGLMGKHKLKRLVNAYEYYRQDDIPATIPATYEVISVRATKTNG